MEAVLQDVEKIIAPGLTHWNHPGFFAYFGITGSGPGILGEHGIALRVRQVARDPVDQLVPIAPKRLNVHLVPSSSVHASEQDNRLQEWRRCQCTPGPLN